MRDVKSRLDNSKPKSCGMTHLQINFKKELQEEIRADAVNTENGRLLRQMEKIMTNRSETTDNHNTDREKYSHSLNVSIRRNALQQTNKANKVF